MERPLEALLHPAYSVTVGKKEAMAFTFILQIVRLSLVLH